MKSFVLECSTLTTLQASKPINDRPQEIAPNPIIKDEKIYAAGTPTVSLGSFGFSSAPATEYTYKRNANNDKKTRKKYHFHELILTQLHQDQSSEILINIRGVFLGAVKPLIRKITNLHTKPTNSSHANSWHDRVQKGSPPPTMTQLPMDIDRQRAPDFDFKFLSACPVLNRS